MKNKLDNYKDGYGLIVQLNTRDGGDTAQREGMESSMESFETKHLMR